MVKEIILYGNKGIALVDDEDYDWLNQYSWCLHGYGYATTSIKNNKKYITKGMHRLIMKEPINLDIDHIDHNVLNNQKNNLRSVVRSQNNMNRKPLKNSSSIFKGVSWIKRDKKWLSRIKLNGKSIHLGVFKSEKDAAIAYNKAAKKLFKKYALLNEVD